MSDESYEVQSEKLNVVQQQIVIQDIDTLPNIVNVNQLKIMYTNSDGLRNKMQELKVLINSTDRPDVIAITECKPKNLAYPVLASEFNLEGYTVYCQGLESKNKRGLWLLLYVNTNIVASVVDTPDTFQESIFVMIKDSNQKNKLLIGNIYRNPKSSPENDNMLYELFKYIQNLSLL